jgi:ubiquinone/menaquinone biosynthesis C-methylase UbiE
MEEVRMLFFQNTRKPVGFGGKLMVKGMNSGTHAKLAEWGLSHLSIAEDSRILDAGCGGGANVRRLLEKAEKGHVTGLDYSEVSVQESQKVNQKAIREGRCDIVHGDVSALPFQEGCFDLVTAFETVYFWPDLKTTFEGIRRVLKEGGTFFICNESDGHDEEAVKFSEIIDGMNLYDAEQLTALLKEAGFHDIQTDTQKIWLCVKAVK